MRIIREYRRVCDDIAAVESQLATASRERDKILSGGMRHIGGIDYSTERVQSGMMVIPPEESMHRLMDILIQIQGLEQELRDMRIQCEKLETAMCCFGDIKKKAIVMRMQGYTNRHIAWEMHFSKRHVERIFSEIRKDVGDMSV